MFSKNFKFSNEVIMRQVQKGQDLQRAGDLKGAEAIYLTILSQNYNELNSLFSLATLYQQTNKFSLAINLFKRLLTIAPTNASIYNNLGGCLHQEQLEEEALECYSIANRLNKESDADVLSNLGGIFVNSGSPEEGLPYLDKALKINPEHAHAAWNKSLLLLELERWKEGFDLYESGMATGDRKNKVYENVPHWDGSKCDTIIVCGEQGIGDEIMFSSILMDLSEKVERIIFDCHPRLSDLFKYHKASRNCDFIVFPTRKKKELNWLKEYKPDFYVNVGSLGKYFRNEAKDFDKGFREPYLYLSTEIKNKWKSILNKISDKPKIGISWFGGAKRTRADIRSIPLEHLIPILNDEKYTFINLQYNIKENDLNEFEKHSGVKIHYVTSEDDCFAWASVANSCDLIISVCTSITHLAGAYGLPCLCMVPSKPAWRYGLKDNKMIWYDSVELVRQKEQDEWGEVITQIKDKIPKILLFGRF